MACGKTLGHGESCVEGNECDQCTLLRKAAEIIEDFAYNFGDNIDDGMVEEFLEEVKSKINR